MLLTNFFVVAIFMIVMDPLLGASSSTPAAPSPLTIRAPTTYPSWFAGLFVSAGDKQPVHRR